MHINFNVFFMKRKEVIDFYNLISTLKVTKINEEISNAILVNTMRTLPYSDTLYKVQEQLRKQLFSEFTQERLSKFEEDRVDPATKQKEFIQEYKDILDANEKFIKALNTYLAQEVNITLEKVSYKSFIKECNKAEQELTSKNITLLSAMFQDYTPEILIVTDEDINELLN